MTKSIATMAFQFALVMLLVASPMHADSGKLVFENWQQPHAWQLHDGHGHVSVDDGRATFIGDATGTNQEWIVFERDVTIDVEAYPYFTVQVQSVTDHWFLHFLPNDHPNLVPVKLDNGYGTTLTGNIEVDLRTIQRDWADQPWEWDGPVEGRFLFGVAGPQTNTMKYVVVGEMAFWADEE